MIRLARAQVQAITAAAEAAYPFEACGLLIGRIGEDGVYEIARVVPSRNVAAEKTGRKDRFEIDPKLRFDVMRACEGTQEVIIGHYHSHPDHPAAPSERDRAMAWDRDFVWIIVAVAEGKAGAMTAHLPAGGPEDLPEGGPGGAAAEEAPAFREIPLAIEG